MLRDMIDVADDKSLSQGTIFNCAHCNSYPDSEILGLVITARCDIANKDKVAKTKRTSTSRGQRTKEHPSQTNTTLRYPSSIADA